ncbi:MAG: hypothetical protein NZ699_08035 [Roseiflexus sp.]|nr:hypothetical protein [Roseiflexus sp.]MCS7289066.1 hypothetical protein [Roseiflexus sp.]MDW8232692.1 hypothetical protein [Roseiflexaceae bacterium]
MRSGRLRVTGVVDRALRRANRETELATAQMITERCLRCTTDSGTPEACARQVDLPPA